jgi:hypothetical protein
MTDGESSDRSAAFTPLHHSQNRTLEIFQSLPTIVHCSGMNVALLAQWNRPNQFAAPRRKMSACSNSSARNASGIGNHSVAELKKGFRGWHQRGFFAALRRAERHAVRHVSASRFISGHAPRGV